MRWIHGEIPFVSSRRERFTPEGTSPLHRKEVSGCTLKGFLSYHELPFPNPIMEGLPTGRPRTVGLSAAHFSQVFRNTTGPNSAPVSPVVSGPESEGDVAFRRNCASWMLPSPAAS